MQDYSEDEEELKICIIPDSFRNNQETMERALKFLGRYYWICSEEYRRFADETYRSLAKIICTEKIGRNKAVSADMLIRRLNEIHADRHKDDDSIDDFMQDFYAHFKSKSAEYSDVSNKKAYKKSMLVSFLDGEYQENNIRAEMLLKQFTEHIKKSEPCREKVFNFTENTAEKTESVCPADRHEHQKSDAVSENGDFTVTDEMRNRVLNTLFGDNKEEICHFTEDTTAEIIEPATTVPEVEERKAVPIPAIFRFTERYQSIWFPDYV